MFAQFPTCWGFAHLRGMTIFPPQSSKALITRGHRSRFFDWCLLCEWLFRGLSAKSFTLGFVWLSLHKEPSLSVPSLSRYQRSLHSLHYTFAWMGLDFILLLFIFSLNAWLASFLGHRQLTPNLNTHNSTSCTSFTTQILPSLQSFLLPPVSDSSKVFPIVDNMALVGQSRTLWRPSHKR